MKPGLSFHTCARAHRARPGFLLAVAEDCDEFFFESLDAFGGSFTSDLESKRSEIVIESLFRFFFQANDFELASHIVGNKLKTHIYIYMPIEILSERYKMRSGACKQRTVQDRR